MANDWIKLSCQVDHRQHEETFIPLEKLYFDKQKEGRGKVNNILYSTYHIWKWSAI